MRAPFVGIVVALAGLLGGCGVLEAPIEPEPTIAESLPARPTPSAGETTTPAPPIPDEIPPLQDFTDIVPPPPLAEYVPYLDPPAETAEEVAAETNWQVQLHDSIAACMAARGFRWVPHPEAAVAYPAGWMGGGLRVARIPFLDEDRQVVARHGYGVTGTPEEEQAAGLPPDPNLEYLESLGEAEAAAYDLALNGDWRVPTTEGSCNREVIDSLPKPTGYTDRIQPFYTEFGDLIRAVTNPVMYDFPETQGVVELNQQWAGCMAAQGFELSEEAAVWGPMAGLDLARRTRPDGTVAPPIVESIAIVDIPAEEWSLLGTEPERAVALADFDCRVETDYLARLAALRVDFDNDIIAANSDALQRLKANQYQ